MAGKAKKRGRPIKPGLPGERRSLGLRVTGELKARLDEAANATGRTQSQEAASRIERTFRDDDLLNQILAAAYGPRLAGLLLMIGRAMHEVGTRAGFRKTHTLEGSVNWLDVPDAFGQARGEALRILDWARPEGDPTPAAPASIEAPADAPLSVIAPMLASANLGAGFTNSILTAMQGRGRTSELERWVAPIREMLGPALAARITRRANE